MGRAAGGRFAVYSSSRGDYFFAEIRHLLVCGLREAGAEAVERDERSGFDRGAQWHVVVGPQQFFYLGAGERLRPAAWPAGVVLYNAEAPGSETFAGVRKLLPRAHAVWDMEQRAASRWAREGLRSGHVPLGWVGECGLFRYVRELPRLAFLRSSCHGIALRGAGPPAFFDRPLDYLFAGSDVPRRAAFFGSAAPRLRRFRSLVRLVDDRRYLRPGRSANLHTRALLGLAQRSKIVLNIHRGEDRYFEGHRIALHGLGQGALVVTEPVSPAPPLKAGRDFVEAPLREIPEAVEYYLSSESGRREAARIAERGLETYGRECRLAAFLPAAVRVLGPAAAAASSRPRLRVETAAALLRAAA